MNKNSVLVGFVVGVSSDVSSPIHDQDTLAGSGHPFRKRGSGKSGPDN